MSILSANTLFHFTDKLKWLINIFDKGFIPRLSKEFYDGNGVFDKDEHGSLVPMVCFCDLPVSQLRNHINTYGQYGIGLEKDWGIQEGLNPVFYITKDSEFVNDYNRIAKGLDDILIPLINHSNNQELRNSIIRLSQQIDIGAKIDLSEIAHKIFTKSLAFGTMQKFYKPYYGKFIKVDKVYENYCYYDEREWRFTPTFKNTDDKTVPEYLVEVAMISKPRNVDKNIYKENITKFLSKSIQAGVSNEELIERFNPHIFSARATKETRAKLNDALAISPRFHLSFALEKVKYIILKNETEINDLIDALRRLHILQPGKFTDSAINLLATKIITCEQIKEDF
ncbi:abortive infection system antitoxin AbiGi family protein [Spirosoma agri]|uniref:Uncharacterized protein n=1 Tax=Spirosoma agri TaxID=1987381 RepID=A0A6M0IFL2_9BACT|nr:abortive infection system antitoxin AbiGi family protein [Spirosoma agri]NEU67070.1 hypothetical protein [Spirosoma agri]